VRWGEGGKEWKTVKKAGGWDGMREGERETTGTTETADQKHALQRILPSLRISLHVCIFLFIPAHCLLLELLK
jgi:hypothetical protein